MSTVFDIFAMALLLISLSIFVLRYIKAEPPITPYLLIAMACGVGNWIGEAIDQFAGVVVLIIASFLLLSCLLHPHLYQGRRRGERSGDGGAAATQDA